MYCTFSDTLIMPPVCPNICFNFVQICDKSVIVLMMSLAALLRLPEMSNVE